MAQLVEALCYKSGGSGFDSRWGYGEFSTQTATEVSARRPAHKADNLTAFISRLSINPGSLKLLEICADLKWNTFGFTHLFTVFKLTMYEPIFPNLHNFLMLKSTQGHFWIFICKV
jgi:hypothetical protein